MSKSKSHSSSWFRFTCLLGLVAVAFLTGMICMSAWKSSREAGNTTRSAGEPTPSEEYAIQVFEQAMGRPAWLSLTESEQSAVGHIEKLLARVVKQTVLDAVVFTGFQGGMYTKPEHALDLNGCFVPYYYKKELFLMPNRAELERELAACVDATLGNRLAGFRINRKIEMDIACSEPKTTVTIEESRIRFHIEMSVSIRIRDVVATVNLDDHPICCSSILHDCLEVARWVTDSHREDP